MNNGNALPLPSNGNLVNYLSHNYVIKMVLPTLQCYGNAN